MERIGVRWTVGDVSARGFAALRLSVWGAYRMFGRHAGYAVCVHTVPLDRARELAGPMPPGVAWILVYRSDVPRFLTDRVDEGMAHGVAWKFAPLRLFPDRHELAVDNDCVVWRRPPALQAWLEAREPACLLAGDVGRRVGIFSDACGPTTFHDGLSGLPPGHDLAHALERALALRPEVLRSELDEQGLLAAALSASGVLFTVPTDDVTIVSPFSPHVQRLGACGAHFVGLNTRDLSGVDGTPASELTAALFDRLAPAIAARLAVDPPAPPARPPRVSPEDHTPANHS